MDLLNMTNRAHIHEFYKKVIYFSNESFQILWLIGGMKVMNQYKISAQYL